MKSVIKFILSLSIFNLGAGDSINPYYDQKFNSIFEIELGVEKRKDDQSHWQISDIDYGGLRKSLCSHLFTQIDDTWSVDLQYDAICRIKPHELMTAALLVRLELVIPQYHLFLNNVYDNDKNFELVLQHFWNGFSVYDQHWLIRSVALKKSRTGRVLSVGSFHGTIHCQRLPAGCRKPLTEIEPYELSENANEVCQKIRQLIRNGRPQLEQLFEGCWAAVGASVKKKINVKVQLFFNWHITHKSELYVDLEQFLQLTKQILITVQSPQKNKFFDVTTVNGEFEDSIIALPFEGNLVRDKGYAGWDSEYQLTYSGLYMETINDVSEQLKRQIAAGEPGFSSLLTMVKTQQIEKRDDKVKLLGYMLISELERDRLSIPSQDLRNRLQNALILGGSRVPSKHIRDLDLKEPRADRSEPYLAGDDMDQ